MVTGLTPFYLLSLIGFASVLYILFYAYGEIANKLSDELRGVSGGFIAYLAVNELLALPFILWHFSFQSYFIGFLILNIPFFVYGVWRLLTIRPLFKLGKYSAWKLISGAAVLACVLIPQYFVKYDADDAFYVALTQQSLHAPKLYSFDPTTGNPSLPFPKTYMFESWEVQLSAFSKIFHIPPLEIAHGLIPLALTGLIFLIHKKIYKKLLQQDWQVQVSLLSLAIILLFGGYSAYSQGTFGLSRLWLGKGIIAVVIVPFLIYLLASIYARPSKKSYYLALLVTEIAALALNPSAIYLLFACLVVLGLILGLKYKSSKHILKLSTYFIPILAVGLVAFFFKKLARHMEGGILASGGAGRGSRYSYYISHFVGDSWYFYVLGVVLIVAWTQRKKITSRLFFIFFIFPIVLLLSFLNPLLFRFVKGLATSNTYWRLLWLIPLTIILPVFASLSIDRIERFAKTAAIRNLVRGICIATLVILLGVGGSFLFDRNQPLIAYDNSRNKIPIGLAGVLGAMATLPEGKTLASHSPAAYLRTLTDKHELAFARVTYLPTIYKRGSQELNEYLVMYRFIEGDTKSFNVDAVWPLLRKYRVKYLILSPRNPHIARASEVIPLPILYNDGQFQILRVDL